MDPGEKLRRRMNWVFYGSMLLQFVALVAIFVGLVARASRPPRPWGIRFTIAGWPTFFAGYPLRAWVRRWFYRRGP